MKRILLLALATLLASNALALITETESNNTMGTANTIVRGAVPWSDVGVLSLAAGGGDVDWFQISLNANEILTLITTPMHNNFFRPDTVMAVFDSGGNLIVGNDDAGNGFGSAVRVNSNHSGGAGTYFIAISGFPDFSFSGSHSQNGNYALTASIVLVPEPASMIALGTGLVGLLGLRRRSKK